MQKALHYLAIGVILCFLRLIATTTFAMFLFANLPNSFLPTGIFYLIMGSICFLFITSVKSSLPFMLSSVQDEALPIVALVVFGCISNMELHHRSGDLESTAILAVAISTFITGLSFYLIGFLKLSFLMRYVPYPVIAGFLGGVGLLLFFGGLKTSIPDTVEDLILQKNPVDIFSFVIALGFAIFLHHFVRLYKKPYAVSLAFFIAITLFFTLAYFSSYSIDYLHAKGFLLFNIEGNPRHFGFFSLHEIDFYSIFLQYGNILAAVTIASFSCLFHLSTIELLSNGNLNIDKELKTAGLSNLIASFFCSSIGYPSFIASSINLTMSGYSRIPGIIGSLLLLLVAYCFFHLLSFIPRFISSGFLLFISYNIIKSWILNSRKDLLNSDYFFLITIATVIPLLGALYGVIYGLIISTFLFAINYSKTSPVKYIADGSSIRSYRQYSLEKQNVLLENRENILFVSLQNYLFFGTSYDLEKSIKKHLNDKKKIKYLLFDFSQVIGMDSSSVISFKNIIKLSEIKNFRLVFCSLKKRTKRSIEKIISNKNIIIFPSTNDGLEWYESTIFAENNMDKEKKTPLKSCFSSLDLSQENIEKIIGYFQEFHIKKDSFLCKEGEDSNELFYIEEGELESYIHDIHGFPLTLSIITAGSTVGEMGFFLNYPRSAFIKAKTNCEIQILSKKAFEKMKHEDPEIACAFVIFSAKIIAKNLIFANKHIKTLATQAKPLESKFLTFPTQI